MAEPLLTGAATKVGGKLAGAASRRGRDFWREEREGHRLLERIAAAVKADADVHHAVRLPLAKVVQKKLETSPDAQGALSLLLDGEDVPEAAAALAQITARLVADEVDWPDAFDARRFGALVAEHARASVNAVKATDRAAAHVDAKETREQVERMTRKVAEALEGRDRGAVPPGLPLLPPFSPGAGPIEVTSHASLLEVLRSSEQRFPLVGRGDVMDEVAEWLSTPPPGAGRPDHRVMVIHGPGGAGKTRLAAEALHLAQTAGWVGGFLGPQDAGRVDWAALSHPQFPLAVAVDYAEARRGDLQHLLQEAPIGRAADAPLRVILVVREGKMQRESWLGRLAGPADLGRRAGELLDEDAIWSVSLEESLPEVDDRQALWSSAREVLGRPGEPPEHLAGPLFERPLYVLLDASQEMVLEDGDEVGDVAPTAQQLLDRVLRHERKYWTEARRELDLRLDEREMNDVAIAATLVGGVPRPAFERALAALEWLQDPGQRRRVADWWCAVYATSSGNVRGIEPDIVGEYQIVRALTEPHGPRDQLGGSWPPERLTALVATASLSGRQRILHVLTRIAASEDTAGVRTARAVLSEVLSRHLDEFLPGALDRSQVELHHHEGRAGESLAATVASAVVAADKLELVTPDLGQGHERRRRVTDDPGIAARAAAMQIVRRQIERIAEREYRDGRWTVDRYLVVMAWTVDLDLRSGLDQLALARIDELARIVPRPDLLLAHINLRSGRRLETARHLDAAEACYQRALAELTALGEQDTHLAYVVWHDLGDIASARGDLDEAMTRYETAWKGKQRVAGVGDESTITTLLAIARLLAKRDVEAARDLLRRGEESIAGEPEEQPARLRDFVPDLMLVAGRQAEREDRLAEAKDLYERGLREMEARGRGADDPLTYILLRDLGDVARAAGERSAAKKLYERALEGKARLAGAPDEDTVNTLTLLVQTIAEEDLDAALALLADRGQRIAADAPLDLQLRLRYLEADLLSEHHRHDQAIEVAREIQDSFVTHEVRQAILDVSADPIVDEVNSVSIAIDGLRLARRAFGSGDPRLPALGARLAVTLAQTVGSLIISKLSLAETSIDEAMRASSNVPDPNRFPEVARLRDEIETLVPDYGSFIVEADARIADAVAQVMAEPMMVPLASPPSGTPDVRDDVGSRNWLVGLLCSKWDGTQDIGAQAAPILTLYVADALGYGNELVDDDEVWLDERSADAAAPAVRLLAADLLATGSVDARQADELARAAHRHAVAGAAERAHGREDLARAERLWLEVIALSPERSTSTSATWSRLAGLSFQRGDEAEELERLWRSAESMASLEVLADTRAASVVRRLIQLAARHDPDRASAFLKALLAEADAAGEAGPRQRLRELEVQLLVDTGERERAAALADDHLDEAVRAALRQAIATRSPEPPATAPVTPSAELALAAAGAFRPTDPRLPRFASALLNVAETAGNEAILATYGSQAGERTDDHERIVWLTVEKISSLVRRAATDLLPVDDDAPDDGGDLLRSWLLRATLEAEKAELVDHLATVLTLLVRLSDGTTPRGSRLPLLQVEIWSSPTSDARVEAEGARLARFLADATPDPQAAAAVVAEAHRYAVVRAGVMAGDLGRIDEGEALLRRALEMVDGPSAPQGSPLRISVVEGLADLALARGDVAAAILSLEQVHERAAAKHGPTHPKAVAALRRLADAIATTDADRAGARIERAIEDAGEDGERLARMLAEPTADATG
ncbi:MAG TPA: hypothetical protein VFG42_26270 [Baekduia sp.]|uniref:tetratricopeptide repeat protein n=1 Tax=Baekduia sp. TaxID=2600305 RepID=UPI002D79F101|nr:hypothetical protein [Baekduia sp.]HET6510327.1 hypothetical protein [Baekduia sp.]